MRVNCAKPRHCTCPAVTHARPLLPHSPSPSSLASLLPFLLPHPLFAVRVKLSLTFSHTHTQRCSNLLHVCVCLYWWLRLLLPTSLLLLLLHAHLVAFNDASRGPHTYTFTQGSICMCVWVYIRKDIHEGNSMDSRTNAPSNLMIVCLYVCEERRKFACVRVRGRERECERGGTYTITQSAPAWAFWGLPDPLTHT